MQRKLDAVKLALWAAAALTSITLGVVASLLVFGPSARDDGGVALIGGAFEMTTHKGEAVDESLLQGRPHLMYFGYTYCPDFCPLELANLAEATALARTRELDVGVVFVTVDPERDTQESLAYYVEAFDDSFIGLRGTPEQTASMAAAYRAPYQSHKEGPDDDDYLVDHWTIVYLMDENGRFAKHFSPNTPPQEIVDALAEVTNGAG